jgi:hypothetical protein
MKKIGYDGHSPGRDLKLAYLIKNFCGFYQEFYFVVKIRVFLFCLGIIEMLLIMGRFD